MFISRQRWEGTKGKKQYSVEYEIRILLWLLQGLPVLLEMSHGTVMHFSWRGADKPLCHTKAEGRGGSVVEMDQGSSWTNSYSALKKYLWDYCSYPFAFKATLDSLIWLRVYLFNSVLGERARVVTAMSLRAGTAQHTPELAGKPLTKHHPVCFGRKDWLSSAPLTTPLSILRDDISYEDFIHFLLSLFLCLFFFPSRLMAVLHFDGLGWVFPRWISALSHIILIIFFRKMMTRKCQEFLGIKEEKKCLFSDLDKCAYFE